MASADLAQTGGDHLGDPPSSVARLEAILDALPARVTVWDRHLILRHANAATVRFASGDHASLQGLHLSDFLGPTGMRQQAARLRKVLNGLPQQFSATAVLPDGTESSFKTVFAPTRAGSTVTGFVVFTLDTTLTRQAGESTLRNDLESAVREQRLAIALDLEHEIITRLQATSKHLDRAAAVAPARSTDLREATTQQIADTIDALRHRIETLEDPVLAPPVNGNVSTRPIPVALPAPSQSTTTGPTDLSADELLAALDALPCLVNAFSPDFVCTFANAASKAWFGRDITGQHGSEILGQDAYQASVGYGERAMRGEPQRFVRTMVRDGRRTHSQLDYVGQVVDGRAIGAVAMTLDVTDEVEVHNALKVSERRKQLIRERTRISHDLHDLVIQRLYAAGLLISGRDGGEPDRIASALDNIGIAITDLRRSVLNVEGAEEDFDFETSAERVLHQTAQVLGFAPTVRWTGTTRQIGLDPGVDALAVLTEALSNAVRHARAGQIEVVLHIDEERMQVVVRDDGIGVGSPDRVSGLRNIATRAERHGGMLELVPQQRGTTVIWEIPLTQGASAP